MPSGGNERVNMVRQPLPGVIGARLCQIGFAAETEHLEQAQHDTCNEYHQRPVQRAAARESQQFEMAHLSSRFSSCTVTFSCAAFALALVERLCQVIATPAAAPAAAAAPSMAVVVDTGMDNAL